MRTFSIATVAVMAFLAVLGCSTGVAAWNYPVPTTTECSNPTENPPSCSGDSVCALSPNLDVLVYELVLSVVDLLKSILVSVRAILANLIGCDELGSQCEDGPAGSIDLGDLLQKLLAALGSYGSDGGSGLLGVLTQLLQSLGIDIGGDGSGLLSDLLGSLGINVGGSVNVTAGGSVGGSGGVGGLLGGLLGKLLR